MSNDDRRLAEQRTQRDRARAEFGRRLARAKSDMAPDVLKRRLTAEVRQASITVTSKAVDIASDNRGVVAATLATLLVWLARGPLLAGAKSLACRYRRRKSPSERLKLVIADYWRRLKDYADE